jgi:hypothetical protein
LTAPLRITVLADSLRIDGRAPERADQAIAELAGLLHAHLIGELTVHAGGDEEAWRRFFLLLGRPPESVRSEGGIAQLWSAAGRHVELREIDYAEILREHGDGEAVAWSQVMTYCLQGRAFELPEPIIRSLLEAAGDVSSLSSLVAAFEAQATSGHGLGARTAALFQLFDTIVARTDREDPDRVEPVMKNIAMVLGQLSPDVLVALLSERQRAKEETSGLVDAFVDRMPDEVIARFVARNAVDDATPVERLAQAFQALVQDGERRERILALAYDDAARSPLAPEGFEESWSDVVHRLLASYSDEPFVSDQYARELSRASSKAIEIEQISDDPPDRLAGWVETVSAAEMRGLDLALVTDLLQIEEDPERWFALMVPVAALLEDLLLLGDFDTALSLLGALERAQQAGSTARHQAARKAIDRLAAGRALGNMVAHLPTLDDAQFEKLKAVCLAIGERLIPPLTEALAAEELTRPRERLTAVLMAFGGSARRDLHRLKKSPNAATRRAAIRLLRQGGHGDAFADLGELLDDADPHVQREAAVALLDTGGDRAYELLGQTLSKGTERSRATIVQACVAARSEHAVAFFGHLLRHVDHRGGSESLYLLSVEALGALRSPAGVPALKEALHRGEWWAPRRTTVLRRAAATALARIGTEDALAVLREAMSSGPAGVRAAAREHAAAIGRGRTEAAS